MEHDEQFEGLSRLVADQQRQIAALRATSSGRGTRVRRGGRLGSAAAVALVLALLLGGAALAAIPGANGVITGCYNKNSGALRVIDSAANQACTNKESLLTWSQTGPQGQQGLTGATGATGPQGPQGPAGVGLNPLQIATLHWYQANTSATFTVGDQPRGIAFDGTNIWVANEGSTTISKLRASDGALIGTYEDSPNPVGIAFDGANIWVTHPGYNSISKLRASDGSLIGTYQVGSNPESIAFDGANIWVVNQGNNTVSKLKASDGTLLGSYNVGTNPLGIAFDGTNIWVTNHQSNSVSKL
jgi:hypothetical protein